MKTRPFKQVDVFAKAPYRGNPLAVVLDGGGLDDAAMQRFARWTNLSETVFLAPPTEAAADYRVRIFTPGGELPFAGHPTLGACHAWLEAGGQPKARGRIVQQCAAGLVNLRVDGEALAFEAPALRRSAPSPTLLAQVARALGLSAPQIVAAQLLDNGPVWLGLLLADADTVLSLTPDHRALKALDHKIGVAGLPAPQTPPLIARANREARAFAPSAGAAARKAIDEADDGADDGAGDGAGDGEAGRVDIEVRAFAASIGIDEDPVTGSFNASLAQWLIADGHLPARYTAGQGQCLGRDGRVHVQRNGEGRVWVGGRSITCIDGKVTL